MIIQANSQQFAARVQNVPASFIREILKVASDPNIVSFAGGLPSPALFPAEELGESAKRVFSKRGVQALQYSSTEGYLPLREYIAERYRRRFKMNISAEQILITNGSQQAVDLIGKMFIDPGDHVMLERPSYLGALQCFSMFQPVFKEVNLQSDGIDTAELEDQLNEASIKLFYCIPNFQNPTGVQYSLGKRKRAAEILRKHRTIVVEDDPYGEISFDNQHIPPLYSFYPEKTIMLGSFSKIVAPGLRLGWMVANREIIKKATVIKQASDLQSGNLSQYILYDFLENNSLDRHVENLIAAYREKRTTMMGCLQNYFPESVKFTRSKGGMFTWLTLPEGNSARELLQQALKERIIFVPGDSFYASDPDHRTLRLNYSNVDEGVMRAAMYKLSRLII